MCSIRLWSPSCCDSYAPGPCISADAVQRLASPTSSTALLVWLFCDWYWRNPVQHSIHAMVIALLHVTAWCHLNCRDIKPNNFLLAPGGPLKLADFGLARTIGSPERARPSGNRHARPYTHQVFARWYRAPELLFGSPLYGFAVDIWAAGCVFAGRRDLCPCQQQYAVVHHGA